MNRTNIIFVTGASRSGTTMLSRMLGANAEILRLRELHYFGDLCADTALSDPLGDDELLRLCAALSARVESGIWRAKVDDQGLRRAEQTLADLPAAQRTGAGVFVHTLMHVAAEAGKTMVCDHTPRNIFYARNLLTAFPNCRIIHVVRDVRAVLASQKNRWRQRGMGRSNMPMREMLRNRLNYHPLTMTRLWLRANQAAVALAGQERFLLTRFEDLVADAGKEIEKICRFIDVEYDPGMLRVPHMGSSHLRNEADKGVSDKVVDQWMKVLNKGEILLCERSAAALMERFSYPRMFAEDGRTAPVLMQLLSYPLHVCGVALSNPRRAWIQLSALVKGGAPKPAPK